MPMPKPQLLRPRDTTYTIVAGDTFFNLAASLNILLDELLAANQNLDPTTLQVGQTITIPSTTTVEIAAPVNTAPVTTAPSDSGSGYQTYTGPSSGFPLQTSWASWETLWSQNLALMKLHDTDEEILDIQTAITSISGQSGVDARFILCIIIQESGGNVRVSNTDNGVTNTGLMQAHNGAIFDANNAAASITQMISDGTMGTYYRTDGLGGDGLQQVLKQRNGNYYEAARMYNSGSVDANQMEDGFTATANYVEMVTNRLMGHQWAGM